MADLEAEGVIPKKGEPVPVPPGAPPAPPAPPPEYPYDPKDIPNWEPAPPR